MTRLRGRRPRRLTDRDPAHQAESAYAPSRKFERRADAAIATTLPDPGGSMTSLLTSIQCADCCLSTPGENHDPTQAHPVAALYGLCLLLTSVHAAEIVRHPLGGGSKFPIARAVEVPAGTTLIFHSGMVPAPADAKAPKAVLNTGETPENAGTQRLQAHRRIADVARRRFRRCRIDDRVPRRRSRKGRPHGLSRLHGSLFAIFRTPAQPNLPSRSTVQVAGLASAGMLVEIEVAWRPPAR